MIKALLIDPVRRTTARVGAPAKQREMQDMLAQHGVIANIKGFRVPDMPVAIYSLDDKAQEFTSGAFEIAGREIRSAAVCLQFDLNNGATIDLEEHISEAIISKVSFVDSPQRSEMFPGTVMAFSTGPSETPDIETFGPTQSDTDNITLQPVIIPERFPHRIVHRGRGSDILLDLGRPEYGHTLCIWSTTSNPPSKIGSAPLTDSKVTPIEMIFGCCTNSDTSPESLLKTDLIRSIAFPDGAVIFPGLAPTDVESYLDEIGRRQNLTDYVSQLPTAADPDGRKGSWKQIQEREILPLLLKGLEGTPDNAAAMFDIGQGWFILVHQGYIRASIHLPDDLSIELDSWPDNGTLYCASAMDGAEDYVAALVKLFETRGLNREDVHLRVGDIVAQEQ